MAASAAPSNSDMGKDAERQKYPLPSAWQRFGRYSALLMLCGFMLLAWLSMLSYSSVDPPSTVAYPPPEDVHNWAGLFGAWLAYLLLYWIGDGAFMLLLFGTVSAWYLLRGWPIMHLPWRVLGLVLMVMATSAGSHMVHPAETNGLLEGSGGVLGISLGEFLREYFGAGAWLVLLVSFGLAVILTADTLLFRAPAMAKWLWARWPRAAAAEPALAGVGAVGAALGRGTLAPRRAKDEAADQSDDAPDGKPATPGQDASAGGKSADQSTSAAGEASAPRSMATAAAALVPPVAPLAQEPFKLMPEPPKPRPKPRPPKLAKPGEYQLPSPELLAEPVATYRANQESLVAEKRGILQQTLIDFGVGATVVGHMTGPVISLFELALEPGVKVSQISSLDRDIARALAVPGVRIVSPLPGRDTVGIEVPNLDKEIVRLKDLLALAPDAPERKQLPLCLGKDASGAPIVADLTSMPHLLMAGTTGSGKSVCINAVIASILLTRTPRECGLILVDPKMVEMASYEKIPHLLCPIVNDMTKVESVLEWAATKMDERYELLKEAGVKNIISFNQLAPEEIYKRFDCQGDADKAHVPTHMPYIVIIIDELADLIMTAPKEVEGHIVRIAQKARAVGIHLIVATQRPSVNVVTGMIRSNMPCRISFRVATRLESRIILDQNGADVLLGQGDMLFLQPGTSHLIRAQGTYVSESEIHALVEHCRAQGEPEYCDELVRIQTASLDGAEPGQRDELFDQAVEIILACQRGSVSLLQRRLQVGYSRASRIVDQMAEAGILGDFKGSQAREVMMTLDDWHRLKSSIQADQTGESAANGEPTSS